jgi:hypothetical protein
MIERKYFNRRNIFSGGAKVIFFLTVQHMHLYLRKVHNKNEGG